MAYTRITPTEREIIATELAQNRAPSAIAHRLGRSRSSITREIRRNPQPDGRYCAFKAQARAERVASSRRGVRKLDQNPYLCSLVEHALSWYWSPEQISRQLTRWFPAHSVMHISHESMYTYLYVQGKGTLKQELTKYLRGQRSGRKPRTGRTEQRGKIPEMISIHERPPEVEDRTVPGHGEGDLIMGAGNRTALGTLAERTSRYLLLVRLKGHDAESVREAFAGLMKQLPEHLRLTMTYDQGKEMALHRLFTAETKVQVYFADPHSPWQRGTNENTNGLVRQFFPKGTDFSEITDGQIRWVQYAMNTRPRKTLDDQSPAEVFAKFYHENEQQRAPQ